MSTSGRNPAKGTVETEWVDRIIAADGDPESTRQRMAARQLDGRRGTSKEIAATIAFIASDRGRFFNGASVIVDGGMTAVQRNRSVVSEASVVRYRSRR